MKSTFFSGQFQLNESKLNFSGSSRCCEIQFKFESYIAFRQCIFLLKRIKHLMLLYFYDVDITIDYRLGKHQKCNNNVIREIYLELGHFNLFVRSFIAMKNLSQRVENQNKEI